MRDLLRPKALLSHVLVLSVVVSCVLLGRWQFDQLERIREDNARSAARLEQPPVDLAALADPTADVTVDEAALEYRRVAVAGTFRPGEEVLQRNRSYQNQTGFHVLTPLELTGGGVVLVRRGWVPAPFDEPPVAEAAPPAGEVRVIGILERAVGQPGFGPTDPEQGELERVFHADTARLDDQVEGQLFPMVLRIDAVASGGVTVDDLPVPVGPPTLDERNHLSYALQWHAFALIALVTYTAWLWTSHRRRTRVDEGGRSPGGERGAGPGSDGDDGGGGGGLHHDPEPIRPLTGTSH